jgi:hypothetical protein
MGRDVFTPQEGARTTMWVATARAADVANGGYYLPPGVVGQTSEAARDDGLGSELRAWTQRIVTGVPYDEQHTHGIVLCSTESSAKGVQDLVLLTRRP